MRYFLAIDIGASSGRHIVGWQENGQICTEEVYRFPNSVKTVDGHLTWDISALIEYVKLGIDTALERYSRIESLAIDTWGVDYVLLRDNCEVLPCYAYRDSRTEAIIPEVHVRMPFSELYRRTGCQFQPFNTVYQLYCDKVSGRLECVTDILMMPEYLLWKLCGGKAREYTNATTTGLVNGVTGEYDIDILRALDLPERLFPRLTNPGTVIGEYKGIRCVLCATHDTASAVEGIPMEGNEPYISSGTWSLLGVKTPKPITDSGSEKANYATEGGIGYNRYQKTIMGMWIANELQSELCPDMSFDEIIAAAEISSCDALIDPNAPEFLAPESMKAAFDSATGGALNNIGDYFRCAYRSLAMSYKKALSELEENSGKKYSRLYIVGGGAKNNYLNRLTEEMSGKQVIALPIEATALGNLKIQMEAYE